MYIFFLPTDQGMPVAKAPPPDAREATLNPKPFDILQ